MGIISKASEVTSDSQLIFGESASGKSTYVLNKVKELDSVLWVAFGNVTALSGQTTLEHVEVAQPTNWPEFVAEVLPYIRSKKWGAIVFDGLNVMLSMFLQDKKPAGGPVEQQQWADASNAIRNAVNTSRGQSENVYGIVDAVLDEESKKLKLALNPYSIFQLLPVFGPKVYTFPRSVKDEKTQKVKDIIYAAQTNSFRALRFDKGD